MLTVFVFNCRTDDDRPWQSMRRASSLTTKEEANRILIAEHAQKKRQLYSTSVHEHKNNMRKYINLKFADLAQMKLQLYCACAKTSFIEHAQE
jgi:hypothetical protein